MEILLIFGASAAQRITYDFLKLLILLPIAIVIDLIIKAIRNKNGKNTKAKAVTKKKQTQSTNKKPTKAEKEQIEKSNKRTSRALWILFWLYVAPVICLVTASLATVIFRTAEVAPITAIITLIIILGVLSYRKWGWGKNNG